MTTNNLEILTENCNVISDITSTLQLINNYHPQPESLNNIMAMLDREVFELFVGDIFNSTGISYLIKERVAKQQFLSASPNGNVLFEERTTGHRTEQIISVVEKIISLSESNCFQASDDLFNHLVLTCYPRDYIDSRISHELKLSLDLAIRSNTVYFVCEKMSDFLEYLQPGHTYFYTEPDYTWMMRSILEYSISPGELLVGETEKKLINTFLDTTIELNKSAPLVRDELSEIVDLELLVIDNYDELKKIFN